MPGMRFGCDRRQDSAWSKGKQNVCCFCIWKDSLNRIGKTFVTVEEARLLLSGKEIDLLNLIGFKSKKQFSCKGILHKRENGKYGIKFLFADKLGVEDQAIIRRRFKKSGKEAKGGQARCIAD